MSKKIIYLLGILLTILIGTWLYYHFCCTCNTSKSNDEIQTIAGNTHNPFALKGNNFNYECNSNFNFSSNGFEINQPVSDSINIGIQLLKDQLEMNPDQKINLTGFCTNEEKNTSSFPNLGFARADQIKSYLVSKGISTNAIDIDGQVRDSWENQDGVVFGPVNFDLKEVTVKADNDTVNAELDNVKAELDNTPLILYFNTSKSSISLSPQEKATVAKILNYLEKMPDAKMNIVGHTDNTGDKDKNVIIGKRRADFAKSFFEKKLDAQRIVTSSKGQDEPIADNATSEGKAKNRRVVITIN